MFAFLGGDSLWPLNMTFALYKAPLPAVNKAMRRTRTPAVAHDYPTLAAALAGEAPFPYARLGTQFRVATRNGWTVVLGTGVPNIDLLAWHQARAQLNVRCDLVGAIWRPKTPTQQPANALFLDYVHAVSEPWWRGGPIVGRRQFRALSDILCVQAVQDDNRWRFNRPGPERPYEDPTVYQARRIADRLPLATIGTYLTAVGVPIDDPTYLTGPVTAATMPSTHTPRWSTMDELRALSEYTATMPRTLTGR